MASWMDEMKGLARGRLNAVATKSKILVKIKIQLFFPDYRSKSFVDYEENKSAKNKRYYNAKDIPVNVLFY